MVVVESDKADMDVETFYDGILAAIVVDEGEVRLGPADSRECQSVWEVEGLRWTIQIVLQLFEPQEELPLLMTDY